MVFILPVGGRYIEHFIYKLYAQKFCVFLIYGQVRCCSVSYRIVKENTNNAAFFSTLSVKIFVAEKFLPEKFSTLSPTNKVSCL